MKIKLYRNLHKNCFSVVNRQTNRVVLHTDRVVMTDVVPRVSEKGRQRVLTEKCKNVHARLYGNMIDDIDVTGMTLREVTYDPYKYSSFVYKDDLTEFTGCNIMLCMDNKLYEIIGERL